MDSGWWGAVCTGQSDGRAEPIAASGASIWCIRKSLVTSDICLLSSKRGFGGWWWGRVTPAIQSCPLPGGNPKASGLGIKAGYLHCSVCWADFRGRWLHLRGLCSRNMLLCLRMVEEFVLQWNGVQMVSNGFCFQLLLWTNVMHKS